MNEKNECFMAKKAMKCGAGYGVKIQCCVRVVTETLGMEKERHYYAISMKMIVMKRTLTTKFMVHFFFLTRKFKFAACIQNARLLCNSGASESLVCGISISTLWYTCCFWLVA